jgi:sugar lactone lactonase YvrE
MAKQNGSSPSTPELCQFCKPPDQEEAISHCPECHKNLCEIHDQLHEKLHTDHKVLSMIEASDLPPPSSSSKPFLPSCPSHSPEKSRLFCLDCEGAFCPVCLDNESHKKHELLSFKKGLDHQRGQMQDLVDDLDSKQPIVLDRLSLVNGMKDVVLSSQTRHQTEINRVFNELAALMEKRRKDLLAELDLKTQKKVENLQNQAKQLERDLDCLENSVSMAQSLIDNASDQQFFFHKQRISDHLKRLNEEAPFFKVLAETKHPTFSLDSSQLQKAKEEICKIGSISEAPSMIRIDGRPRPAFTKPIDFSRIKKPRLVIGEKGQAKGQFDMPRRAAIDQDNNIIVADNDNNFRIQIFDERGRHLRTYTFAGTKEGTLDNPSCVDVDHENNIVFFGSNTNTVKILNRMKTSFWSFGGRGPDDGQFIRSQDLVIDHNNNFIVSDYGNNRVQIFDEDGKHLRSFGSKGSSDGQFDGPHGITIDHNNNILVCDTRNHRVQIFDEDGKHLRSFGSKGSANGEFELPNGVAVDQQNNILVTDWGNSRVQVFDQQGKWISSFGTFGSDKGQFDGPQGITVDNRNRIIVCEVGNNRIQVF